ncbi:hypothetical protein [Cellvibrio sp. OA-2007]|uniref:hypothetical protein n=1 Tax=Cellvibrio sp. OA-2007 TaxID=529823 RepID=UPI0007803E34|nr:hypothetical protein [Cellvibrio sp. OA-2007]
MNLLLPPGQLLFWLSLGIAIPILVLAIRHAPWRQLLVSQPRQHALFATILALALLWLLQVSVRDTLAIHPLLMTVTTMIFGWSLAVLIGAAALIALEIYQVPLHALRLDWDVAVAQFDLSTFPVDFCLSVVVPVSWAWCVLWLVDRWKFKNPFTYFWGVGFFGAMLSCIWLGLIAMLLFAITGSEVQLATTQEHFIVFVLMTFPEGFVNGLVATVMTVLYPDMVKTYRDDWYLKD